MLRGMSSPFTSVLCQAKGNPQDTKRVSKARWRVSPSVMKASGMILREPPDFSLKIRLLSTDFLSVATAILQSFQSASLVKKLTRNWAPFSLSTNSQ